MKHKKFDPKKLKAERKRLGFSFGKFAIALQAHQPRATKAIVWQWENGKHQPSAPYLHALCAVFGREIDFFYKNSAC